MNETRVEQKWYALQLRPRFEKVVALHLQRKGFEEYLPTYKSRRRWSDRVKEIELPLFPGYVFCKFDVMNRLPILVIPGVMSIVNFGGSPLSVDESEIRAVQAVTNSGLTCGPFPFMAAGTPVRVRYGPLRGMEGFVVEAKDTYQLIISVTLLSRSVSVTIDRDCVTPLCENDVNAAVV